MRRSPGNDLILGKMPGANRSLGLSRTERDKHLYICGGTGTGKSKFLENLIRQDIRNWSKSKCGMLVLDPHGSLYDNLINWLAWTELEGQSFRLISGRTTGLSHTTLFDSASSPIRACLSTISFPQWPTFGARAEQIRLRFLLAGPRTSFGRFTRK